MYLLIVLGLVLISMVLLIVTYNKLVAYRNRMHEAWSGIDVFLKKRHDLVPTLVQTVKGYAFHEKEVLEEATRLRAQAMQAKEQGVRIGSETALGKALERLMVVVERYPDLKANISFLELQKQLAEIEDELSLSRRYYNGTVRENNIYVERFPSNLVAALFHFPKGAFFEMDRTEKTVPNVSM